MSKLWKALAIIPPICWLLQIVQYKITNCANWPSWPRSAKFCGNDAKYVIALSFFIFMSFPVVYFIKRRKLKKQKESSYKKDKEAK